MRRTKGLLRPRSMRQLENRGFHLEIETKILHSNNIFRRLCVAANRGVQYTAVLMAKPLGCVEIFIRNYALWRLRL